MNVASTTRLSVLLIDDEPALLEVTARLLRAAELEVSTCTRGDEAAALLQDFRFDVVVSDLAMPGLNGVALLRFLREHDIDVPVVLVTGSPTLDSAMKAVEYGAFKYLTKPVDRAELVDTIERAAGHGATRRAAHATTGEASATTSRDSVVEGAVLGGRYRLVRTLGTGGMGEVWEATHAITGRPVALKVLHPALNTRREMRRRLLREARAATALAHPHVVEVFDVFELDDGTPLVVMELLHGRALRERLDAGPAPSLQEACCVMAQVVSAVGAGHARGVIHRDLKPENVFLRAPDGAVKVMDFGVAKLVHVDPAQVTSSTMAGAAVGTIGYMAPEQACGEDDVDHRADLWAIGAVTFEALTGARAVPGTTLGQVITRQLTERPPSLTSLRPDVPASLDALVTRLLERAPAARPADLREVLAELRRHTSVEVPTFGPPAPMSERARNAEDAAASLGSAPTEVHDAARRRG